MYKTIKSMLFNNNKKEEKMKKDKNGEKKTEEVEEVEEERQTQIYVTDNIYLRIRPHIGAFIHAYMFDTKLNAYINIIPEFKVYDMIHHVTINKTSNNANEYYVLDWSNYYNFKYKNEKIFNISNYRIYEINNTNLISQY